MKSPVRLASALLVAHLGGGVVGPVLHLARHRPDHTHGPGAVDEQARGDRHDHHDDHRPGRPEDGAAKVPPPGDHGHGSPLHFGLALLATPPAIEVPRPAPSGWISPGRHERSAVLRHVCFPPARPPPAPALG